MIPKDKAKELVDKFYQTTPNESWFNPPVGVLQQEYKSWEHAKEMALIAVDEIKKANPTIALSYMLESEAIDAAIEYWNEVKTEINKLQP